jgi:putative peptidoglycan lipid II flippase
MNVRDKQFEDRALWRATAGVVGLAALGKGVAFLREPAVAAALGASAASDAYYLAVGLPFLVYNLAAVPFSLWVTARLAGAHSTAAEDGTAAFYRRMLVAAVFFAAFAAVAAAELSRPLVRLYAPGLDGARLEDAAALTRVGALALPALALQAVCSARLYSDRRFTIAYAWTAVGGVVGFAGVLTLAARLGAAGAVWAFVLASWTTAVGVLLSGWSSGQGAGLAEPVTRTNDFGPGMISRAIALQVFHQVSGLLVYGFGSQLAAGGIAATLFASKIIMAAYETIVLTAGVMLFPRIARLVREGDDAGAGEQIARAFNWLVPVMAALMVVVVLFRLEIVSVIYSHRAFEQHAADLVTAALLGYVPAILGLTLIEIQHRILVLRGRLGGYIVIVVAALSMNWATCSWLVPHLGILGLALGTSIGVLTAAVGLWTYAAYLLPHAGWMSLRVLAARAVPATALSLLIVGGARAWLGAPTSLGGRLASIAGGTLTVALLFLGTILALERRLPWSTRSGDQGATA